MAPAPVKDTSPIASGQNPSSADTSSGFQFGGIHAQGGFAGGTDSRRPERAWPRLVKVRKQVGFQDPRARSRGSEAVGSGNGGAGNGGFVFGADRRGVAEGSVKVGSLGFVFGVKENGLESNVSAGTENLTAKELKPGKIDSNAGSFLFSLNAKGSEFGRNSCCSNVEKTTTSSKANGFVFQASQPDLASNLNSGFHINGAGEKTGHENSVKTSTFVDPKLHDSSSRAESNANSEKSDFAAKCRDEIKFESGDLGNSNHNLGPDIGFRFNTNGDCSGSFSSTNSEFKLPDEMMRKLKINESDNSNTNSFPKTGTKSMTRRHRNSSRGLHKVSNFSCKISENISSDKSSKANTERFKLNTPVGSSENGVPGTSGSEAFTFQAKPSHNRQDGDDCCNRESNADSLGQDKSTVSSIDFGTPLCNLSSLKESLFSEKNRPIKDRRVRETKRKPKKSVIKQHCDQEDPKTPGCYSPMDFSPYQESTVADQCPKETSVNSEKQEICQTLFHCSPRLDDKTTGFNFSAVSSEDVKSSVRRRRFRRKSRIGVGHESFVINPSTNLRSEVDQLKPGPQLKQDHCSPSAKSHEICESWRFRGNQAYKNGELSKAEAFYTQGIVCVPSNERSGPCLEPLLLCYSNRAAARMHLQRVREAIWDCAMAALLDPTFIKVQLRAANCHLMLGEIEDALQYFSQCIEKSSGVCLDRRIILDAADGQQRAQKMTECINRSAKLLEEKSPDAALSALDIISEALSICSHSEELLKLKAKALIVLRRHDEAIQLCEQSLSFAEKNFKDGSANGENVLVRLWRWNLISKSYFHLGKFEAALTLLDKLKQIEINHDESARKDIESSTLLSATIRNLLQHKNAGNESFKSGKYSEAVESYTLALSTNFESRRFAAICFCNRAAAHQALNQIVDAIADCSLAIALDGNYAKAVSRRAVLHEMIRDYGQAANDLQRVVAILESQPSDNVNESGKSSKSTGQVKEMRQAQMRLPVMEEEAKKEISLNFYLILNSKQTDTSADIKKAYRKAALKHHPDKAGQFLTRSESGNEVWKEIAQEVNKDADRLFKMIGEAYAVLSDSSKRSQHDLDEELRSAAKECNGNSPSRASRRYSDAHTSTSRSTGFGSSNFEQFFAGRRSYRPNYRDYYGKAYY